MAELEIQGTGSGSKQGKWKHHQEVSKILGKALNGAPNSNSIYSIILQRINHSFSSSAGKIRRDNYESS